MTPNIDPPFDLTALIPGQILPGGPWTRPTLPIEPRLPVGIEAVTADGAVYHWNGTTWVSGGAGGNGSGQSNFTTQNTQHLRAGLARVRSGQGGMKVACIGDSTFAGYSTSFTGGKAISPPTVLSQILTARGIAAQSDSWWGDGRVGGTPVLEHAYNPAWSATGWQSNGGNCLGGFCWQSLTVGNILSFTPAGIFDTFDVYYLKAPNGSTFTIDVDGGAPLSTISTNGANAYLKTTITVPRATHTINCTISVAGSQSAFITSMAVRDSTISRVEVYNMGASGYTAPLYVFPGAVPQVTPQNALPVVAPDVTFINLTINDINLQSIPLSAYSAALQTLVTASLVTGDCILMVGSPGGTANYLNGNSVPYVAAVYAVAAANNIPVLDITARWISYADAQLVMPYADASTSKLHPGAVGYADIAAAMNLFFI